MRPAGRRSVGPCRGRSATPCPPQDARVRLTGVVGGRADVARSGVDGPRTTAFTLNGRPVEVRSDHPHLLAALREELDVTSPKDGCSPSGQCGCCTVLLDDRATVACQVSLARAAGRFVVTLEGFDRAERARYAAAFAATGALQCGFCTPGIVVRLKALLDRKGGRLSREEAADTSGPICAAAPGTRRSSTPSRCSPTGNRRPSRSPGGSATALPSTTARRRRSASGATSTTCGSRDAARRLATRRARPGGDRAPRYVARPGRAGSRGGPHRRRRPRGAARRDRPAGLAGLHPRGRPHLLSRRRARHGRRRHPARRRAAPPSWSRSSTARCDPSPTPWRPSPTTRTPPGSCRATCSRDPPTAAATPPRRSPPPRTPSTRSSRPNAWSTPSSNPSPPSRCPQSRRHAEGLLGGSGRLGRPAPDRLRPRRARRTGPRRAGRQRRCLRGQGGPLEPGPDGARRLVAAASGEVHPVPGGVVPPPPETPPVPDRVLGGLRHGGPAHGPQGPHDQRHGTVYLGRPARPRTRRRPRLGSLRRARTSRIEAVAVRTNNSVCARSAASGPTRPSSPRKG